MYKLKLLSLLLIGTLVLLTSSSESMAGLQGKNLIKNGDFSKELKSWGCRGKGEAEIRIDNGQLLFKKKGKEYVVLLQWVNTPSPGEYKLKVLADSGNMAGCRVILTPFINGRFSDKHNSYIRFAAQSGEQQLAQLINIGPEVKKVQIRLFGNAAGARFSAVSLKQISASDKKVIATPKKLKQLKRPITIKISKGNLIKNGNFVNGLKGWYQQGKGKSIIKMDNGRIFFQKKDKAHSALYQDLPITSPGVYSIEVIADSRNGSDCKVLVTPFSGGKYHDRQNSYLYLEPKNGIQQLSKLINIGPEVTKVRIRLIGNKSGTLFSAVALKKNFARKINQIPIVPGQPRLDGVIDEPYWRNALVLADFRVLGDPAVKAAVATKVLLASSDGYLYVAYEVEEPKMAKATIVRKNSMTLYNGDDVELFISPDRKNFYQFLVNAEGYSAATQKVEQQRQLRTIWYNEASEAREFFGDWKTFAHKDDKKFTVEMKIKLADIYGNKTVKNPELYLNFTRHRTVVTDAQKYTNWAGLAGNTFHSVKNFPAFKLKWAQIAAPVAKLTTNSSSLGKITQPLALPKLLIAGKPIKMVIGKGEFTLPKSLSFSADAFNIDSGVKQFVGKGIAGNRQGRAVDVKINQWNDRLLKRLLPVGNSRISSAEAFILNVTSDSIKINARTRDGALRALATLALLGSQAKSSKNLSLPCFTMVDAPYFKIRGWDGGGVRRPNNLKKLIDLYFLLRLNHLQFQVSTYGKNAAFPFASHANIGKSKSTKQDYRELADYARARGITLVPLFYSWSRSGFIFNKPEYRHLAANSKIGETKKGDKWFYNRNANGFNPETEKLIFDLYDELIETMKLKHLNPGLDEVHYGIIVDEAAPYSKGKTRFDWLKTVVTKTSRHLAAKGVKMWMYADQLNPYHSGSINGICDPIKDADKLAAIPKNITMSPWRYRIPATGRYNSVEFFKQLGYQVVGVPCWYRINNVPTFISDLVIFKGDGIVGSTWGNPRPDYSTAELFSAISMLSYLAWSPENCDLADYPFVSSSLYQHAAYRYGNEHPYTASSKPLTLPKSTATQSVEQLKPAIGFPDQLQLDFLQTAFTTQRGVKMVPFGDNGQPVAGVVHGAEKESLTIPVNQRCRYISLLHAVNKMYDYDGRKLAKKYGKTIAGNYKLIYDDGTTAMLPLKLRTDVSEWNDGIMAKKCEPGIYGSMAGRLHINIPLYTWKNPFPNKTIKSLVISSGNHKAIDLYLFGVSVD